MPTSVAVLCLPMALYNSLCGSGWGAPTTRSTLDRAHRPGSRRVGADPHGDDCCGGDDLVMRLLAVACDSRMRLQSTVLPAGMPRAGGGVGGEATLVGGDIADGGSACDCFGAIGEEAVLIIIDDLDLRGGNEWWWRHRLVDARRRGGRVPCELRDVLREALVIGGSLDLWGGDEGQWKRGLGEGLADLCMQHPQLLTQHPRNLLNQQGIHGIPLVLGLGLG
jgi:hypothetical protein